MRNSKLRRDKRDKAALRANKQHARVHVGHATHADNITPAYAAPSMSNVYLINEDNTDPYYNEPVDQATRIRLARQRAGLTQAQLASKLGVRQSAVSQWEKGRVSPELQTRLRLAALLRIPVSDLLPEMVNVPDDALRDPQALRVIAQFFQLQQPMRDFVELFLDDLVEKLKKL